ncbi:MAG: hypothetical protein ACOCWO_02760 [Candidatus Muiribacteriaceae bacterium]
MDYRIFLKDTIRKYIIACVFFSVILIFSFNLLNSQDDAAMLEKTYTTWGLKGNYFADVFRFAYMTFTWDFARDTMLSRKRGLISGSKIKNSMWFIFFLSAINLIICRKKMNLFMWGVLPYSLIAVIALSIFSRMSGIFPFSGYSSFHYEELSIIGKVFDRIYHLFLPLLCTLPLFIYIRGVLFREKNHMSFLYMIPFIIGAVVLAENVFAMPGAGYTLVNSVKNMNIIFSVKVLWLIVMSGFILERVYSFYIMIKQKGQKNEN